VEEALGYGGEEKKKYIHLLEEERKNAYTKTNILTGEERQQLSILTTKGLLIGVSH
jgi:hypothetical protein